MKHSKIVKLFLKASRNIGRVKELSCNTKGSGAVNSIVISAIVLIGIVLLNPTIRNFISDVWNLFSGFVLNRLTTLFNS